MADSSRGASQQRADNRFWPFGPRAAVFAVPAVLLSLLVLLGILRGVAGWPDRRWDGWILLGIGVLALVPVLLVVLGSVAGPGAVFEVPGLKLRWGEVVSTQAVTAVTVHPRLGLQQGLALNDSNTAEIVDTLRTATSHDVAVLDLEDGQAWWETRLLVLCAGATRLGRPVAIVFVATEASVERRFQGWARPSELLRQLIEARDDLRVSYEQAAATAKQWELALPPASGAPLQLPWSEPPGPPRPGYAVSIRGGREQLNEFAPEQILAEEVGKLEQPSEPKGINVVRLRELFAPYLRTVVVAESAENRVWVAAVLSTTEPFLAVTGQGGRYLGLVPRDLAVNDILTALTSPTE